MHGDRTWEIVDEVLVIARTLLIYGAASGTGKSRAAHSQVGLDGRKLYSLTLTPDSPAAELRGHYVPDGQQFRWQDGPAMKAWRQGARLVVNELDHAGGDVISFLLAALDSPETARLTLPTGETVTPHPRFQCVATMNGSPDDLLPALRDRFPATVEITTPHPGGIAKLPEDLRNAARGSVATDDPSRRISLRAWLAFADFRAKVGEETAAFVVFGKRARDVLASLKIAR